MAVPRLSQETLAEMVGTTRSRVSFFINRLRKFGFINYASGREWHFACPQLPPQYRAP
jgi:CRP/FNR family transcriptional regulator, cyclic AMP receptor protein